MQTSRRADVSPEYVALIRLHNFFLVKYNNNH